MQNQPHRPVQAAMIGLSFGFAALIFAMQNAHAQIAPQPLGAPNQCGARAAVLAALENTYGEGRVGVGMAGGQNVLEVFANTQTGTWTVITTRSNGITCLLASGTNYEALTPQAPASGSPA